MKLFLRVLIIVILINSMAVLCNAADQPVVLYMSQNVSGNYLYLSLHIENTQEIGSEILAMKISLNYNGRYFRPVLENNKIFVEDSNSLINPGSPMTQNTSGANSLIILTTGSEGDITTTDGLLGTIKFEFLRKDDMPVGTYSFDYMKKSLDNEIVTVNYISYRNLDLYGTFYVNQVETGETNDNSSSNNENITDNNDDDNITNGNDNNGPSGDNDNNGSSGDNDNDSSNQTENNSSDEQDTGNTPGISVPPVYVGGGKIQYSDGTTSTIGSSSSSSSNTNKQDEKSFVKRIISFEVGNEFMCIDDEIIPMEAAPYIKNDRCLLPIRYLAEALSYSVEWVESTRKVIIRRDNILIEIFIDGDIAYVNGETYLLDAPPEIVADRTFVPIRFITENLSGDVKWDEDTRSVIIEMLFEEK